MSRIAGWVGGQTGDFPPLCANSGYNTYTEVEEKLNDWLAAGARLVPVLNPRMCSVSMYTSPTAAVRLTAPDTLSGGEGLPGFTC